MMGLVGMMTAMSVELMREGVGSRLGTWNFWGPALSTLFLGLLLFGFLHLAAIALISPSSANRALPLRSYATGAWLLTFVVAIIWALNDVSRSPLVGWASTVTGLVILALLIALAGDTSRGKRATGGVTDVLMGEASFDSVFTTDDPLAVVGRGGQQVGPYLRRPENMNALLAQLRKAFHLTVAMSGSGSACFALLEEKAPVAEITAAIRAAWGPTALVVETKIG